MNLLGTFTDLTDCDFQFLHLGIAISNRLCGLLGDICGLLCNSGFFFNTLCHSVDHLGCFGNLGGLCGTTFCQIGSCLCQLLGTTIDLLCADLNGGQCLLHIGNDLHHGILDLYKVTDIFFRRLYTVIALTHLT